MRIRVISAIEKPSLLYNKEVRGIEVARFAAEKPINNMTILGVLILYTRGKQLHGKFCHGGKCEDVDINSSIEWCPDNSYIPDTVYNLAANVQVFSMKLNSAAIKRRWEKLAECGVAIKYKVGDVHKHLLDMIRKRKVHRIIIINDWLVIVDAEEQIIEGCELDGSCYGPVFPAIALVDLLEGSVYEIPADSFYHNDIEKARQC